VSHRLLLLCDPLQLPSRFRLVDQVDDDDPPSSLSSFIGEVYIDESDEIDSEAGLIVLPVEPKKAAVFELLGEERVASRG
jgi:hypothetical protein